MIPVKQMVRTLPMLAMGVGLFVVLLIRMDLVARAKPVNQIDVCATCQYTSIQAAVNAAHVNDTIRVAQGVYQDIVTDSDLVTTTVLITKDLRLIGGFSPDFQSHDPSVYTTTVDGQNIVKGFSVLGSNVHIEGFDVANTDQHGIWVHASNNGKRANATIGNNQVRNGQGIGIFFYRSDGTISSSLITSNIKNGVAIVESTVDVISNTITNNSDNGIYVGRSTVVIDRNTVMSNTSGGGAGLVLETFTTFTVTNNVINNNQALLYSGGGIAVYDRATGIIEGNQITNNIGDYGGGIGTYESGSLTIRNNIISNNRTPNRGGGIHVNPDDFLFSRSSELVIVGNRIDENQAIGGAGIDIVNVNGAVSLHANSIRSNKIAEGAPDYESGGIHVWGIGGPLFVVNNLLVNNDNRNLKAVNIPQVQVINNTITGSRISLQLFSSPDPLPISPVAYVVNNIITSNSDCGVNMFNGITLSGDYNLLHDNNTHFCGETAASNEGNVYSDPLFVDPTAGNYQLQSGSPAIDSATNGSAVPTVDIGGNARPQGSGVDMGAHESIVYQTFLSTLTR